MVVRVRFFFSMFNPQRPICPKSLKRHVPQRLWGAGERARLKWTRVCLGEGCFPLLDVFVSDFLGFGYGASEGQLGAGEGVFDVFGLWVVVGDFEVDFEVGTAEFLGDVLRGFFEAYRHRHFGFSP
jgi:hypothetical protein